MKCMPSTGGATTCVVWVGGYTRLTQVNQTLINQGLNDMYNGQSHALALDDIHNVNPS